VFAKTSHRYLGLHPLRFAYARSLQISTVFIRESPFMDAMDGFLVMCIRIASRSHGFMHLGSRTTVFPLLSS
jgi:hypothetical protein